jgi:acyl-CoA reductase-like NAD-dependent aldehyde dehydrogenase
VAPAIAMGCPFVLKPAPQAPVCALMLAEVLSRIGLPHGAFSVVPCHVEDAVPLITDERINLLSFTGSAAVGWMLKSKAGKKKVVLELGGNAACIIDRDADLDHAISRVITGGFALSGQSCISVQRLFVHESIYEDAKARLISASRSLPIGDPRLDSTVLGPLISEHDAERIADWVNEAIQSGSRLLCGGRRVNRSFFEATILESVPETCRLWAEEIFGPVIAVRPFARLEEAFNAVNRSRYGLQAGIFTNDPATVETAWNELDVGGVIVNDVPTMRLEGMPYGGVKDSGCGREGVRFAMLEMSEPRLLLKRLR